MRVHDTVRTTVLSDREFIAPKQHKAARRAGQPGVVSGILGKRDPRKLLVTHEGETIPAVYFEDELEPEPRAWWRVQYSRWGRGYFEELPTYHDARLLQQELEDDGVRTITIEGPFYGSKELEEGLLPTRTLFEHLKNDE
jgi:hypothetical protein